MPTPGPFLSGRSSSNSSCSRGWRGGRRVSEAEDGLTRLLCGTWRGRGASCNKMPHAIAHSNPEAPSTGSVAGVAEPVRSPLDASARDCVDRMGKAMVGEHIGPGQSLATLVAGDCHGHSKFTCTSCGLAPSAVYWRLGWGRASSISSRPALSGSSDQRVVARRQGIGTSTVSDVPSPTEVYVNGSSSSS
jgi:hypothetical protein